MTVRTVAYLTGGYPRVTDAFLHREINGVEACGITVERFAVRRPADADVVGDDQRAERDRTTYLLDCSLIQQAVAVIAAFRRSPKRFLASARLAFGTRRLGSSGAVHQLAYFVEAAVLADLMAERRVDHLHDHFSDASCTVAMLASSLSGIPFSFTVHGPAIFFEAHLWHLRTKLEAASFVVAISSYARSQASLFSDPAIWDRIHVVHCGVDRPAPSAPATPQRDRAADSPANLLFVGRLERIKGLMVLLDAVARMVEDGRSLQLTLVGDGSQHPELAARLHELGLTDIVHFDGYRSQVLVQERLADADVLVLPSYSEGVPISLMEAFAASLPVVATNVGGVTELVHHDVNGLVVNPATPRRSRRRSQSSSTTPSVHDDSARRADNS